MPLQIGVAALASLARAAAFLLPGLVLTGIAIWIMMELPDLGELGGYIFAVIGGPPIALLAFAWKHLRRARDQRPSDLVLDEKGFTVDGGPLDRTRVEWAEVKACELILTSENEKDEAIAGIHRVRLDRSKGGTLWLAGTDDDVERASLDEVVKTLNARELSPKSRKLPPEVVLCRGCKAPVPPSAEPSAACAFCGETNEVPQSLRDRLAAQQKVDSRDAKAVARLLDQPGARFVGTLYAGGAGIMLAAWPVAAGVLWLNYANELLSWLSLLATLVFVAACILGFFTFLRGRLVDRQALRLLTVRFCARASGPGGKGLACRSCFAPLPIGAPRALVACAYCGAPNVLAVDFTAQANAVEEEQFSLSRALERRRRERSTWRFATLGGLLLIGGSAWALVNGVGRHPSASACKKGDAKACVEVARFYMDRDWLKAEALVKPHCDRDVPDACAALAELYDDDRFPQARDARPVAEKACSLGAGSACEMRAECYRKDGDPKKAAETHERGCTLGNALSCTDFGYALFKGNGVEKDDVRAVAAYQRACDAGNAMGCNNLGAMYFEGSGGLPHDRVKAKQLYDLACSKGAETGCSNGRGMVP